MGSDWSISSMLGFSSLKAGIAIALVLLLGFFLLTSEGSPSPFRRRLPSTPSEKSASNLDNDTVAELSEIVTNPAGLVGVVRRASKLPDDLSCVIVEFSDEFVRVDGSPEDHENYGEAWQRETINKFNVGYWLRLRDADREDKYPNSKVAYEHNSKEFYMYLDTSGSWEIIQNHPEHGDLRKWGQSRLEGFVAHDVTDENPELPEEFLVGCWSRGPPLTIRTGKYDVRDKRPPRVIPTVPQVPEGRRLNIVVTFKGDAIADDADIAIIDTLNDENVWVCKDCDNLDDDIISPIRNRHSKLVYEHVSRNFYLHLFNNDGKLGWQITQKPALYLWGQSVGELKTDYKPVSRGVEMPPNLIQLGSWKGGPEITLTVDPVIDDDWI